MSVKKQKKKEKRKKKKKKKEIKTVAFWQSGESRQPDCKYMGTVEFSV